MEIKDGKQTSEFQMTAVVNVVNAVAMLLIMYGVLTQETAAAWVKAITAVLMLVLPLASALMTKEYTRGRTAIKLEAMVQEGLVQDGLQPGAASHRPEAAE